MFCKKTIREMSTRLKHKKLQINRTKNNASTPRYWGYVKCWQKEESREKEPALSL